MACPPGSGGQRRERGARGGHRMALILSREAAPADRQSHGSERSASSTPASCHTRRAFPVDSTSRLKTGQEKVSPPTQHRSVHSRLLLSGMPRYCRTRWSRVLQPAADRKRRPPHKVQVLRFEHRQAFEEREYVLDVIRAALEKRSQGDLPSRRIRGAALLNQEGMPERWIPQVWYCPMPYK